MKVNHNYGLGLTQVCLEILRGFLQLCIPIEFQLISFQNSHRIAPVGCLEICLVMQIWGKIINVFTFIPQLQRLCTSASPRICTDHPGKTWGGGGIPAQSPGIAQFPGKHAAGTNSERQRQNLWLKVVLELLPQPKVLFESGNNLKNPPFFFVN